MSSQTWKQFARTGGIVCLVALVCLCTGCKQPVDEDSPPHKKTPAEQLNEQIDTADLDLLTTAVSVNGIDVAFNAKWVTQTVATAYEDEIGMARSVLQRANPANAAITQAMNDLQTATETFTAKKKNGFKGTGLTPPPPTITAIAAADDPDTEVPHVPGEKISLAGIIITGTTDEGAITVPASACTVTVPADGKIPAAQTAGSFPITISYTNPETGGTTVTVDHTVSVVETGIGGTYKKTYKVGGVEFNMMYVPTGKFQRDTTATNVTVVDRPYRMAETETSLALFNAVMSKKLNSNGEWVTDTGYNRSGTLTNPAGTISFYDAIAFCNKLSVRLGKKPVYSVSTVPDWGKLEFSQIPAVRSGGTPSGNGNADWHAVAWNDDADHDGFRLPTEWEWMWAEIGASNRTANGSGVVVLPNYADVWSGQEIAGAAFADYVAANPPNTLVAVTGKLPNSLGLYNMSGNVMETCWDKIESNGTATDPKWPSGEQRTSVYKGGTGNNRAETGGTYQNSETDIKKFVHRSISNPPHYARWGVQGFRFVINQ